MSERTEVLEKLGYMTEDDLAGVLGVTVKTLKNRARVNLPPYVKAGHRWLFKTEAVKEYLEARTVTGA